MKYRLLIAWMTAAVLHAETTIQAPPAEPAAKSEAPKTEATAPETNAEHPAPKPLAPPTLKGLAWLVKTQNPDGGWGQGGGWRVQLTDEGGGRVEGENVPDPSDIGNTAIVLQAFLRAGARLDEGDYASVTTRAANYILDRVDQCDEDSLFVTDVRDTQLQSKIGRYVDTFLAAQILSDLKGRLPEANEKRRAALLDKVVAKIKNHQQDNGAFAGNSGWASTLSQGICSKALNSAWDAGAKVDLATLEKDHRQNAEGLNRESGVVASSGAVADAGVEIYRYASKLGGMTEFARTNDKRRDELNEVVASPNAPAEEKKRARGELKKIEEAGRDQEVLLAQVAARAAQPSFVQGFGNNGGEEFISYMNIGEALCQKGGEEWENWEKSMGEMLAKAQNEDGSWSGHHCITGRTFCTASALMVLMTDRAVAQADDPIAAKDNAEQP